MNKAEQFCKLNGIEWYGYTQDDNLVWQCTCCDHKTYDPQKWLENPTFTDAKSILEVMMKRDDYDPFLAYLYIQQYKDSAMEAMGDYILNPDKLLDEAIKFCEEGHE